MDRMSTSGDGCSSKAKAAVTARCVQGLQWYESKQTISTCWALTVYSTHAHISSLSIMAEALQGKSQLLRCGGGLQTHSCRTPKPILFPSHKSLLPGSSVWVQRFLLRWSLERPLDSSFPSSFLKVSKGWPFSIKTTFQANRLWMECVETWASTGLSSCPTVYGEWLVVLRTELAPSLGPWTCLLRGVPGHPPSSLKRKSQPFCFHFTPSSISGEGTSGLIVAPEVRRQIGLTTFTILEYAVHQSWISEGYLKTPSWRFSWRAIWSELHHHPGESITVPIRVGTGQATGCKHCPPLRTHIHGRPAAPTVSLGLSHTLNPIWGLGFGVGLGYGLPQSLNRTSLGDITSGPFP